MSNTAVGQSLDKYLANLHILYAKTHNYHWNVEGKQFFTVHAKLEEIYEHIADEIDAIAERILIIGQRPSSSLAAYLKLATLKEADAASVGGEAVVKNLLSDIQALIADLKKDIKAAQDAGDEVTADLLIDSLGYYEKTAWMFGAYLKS
ncbi:Dps family protein [Acetonema longum]|uniref:DNA protection during starvation protein n=1 Tax=Acetonema longum DSM 6540 TaxID=1009370 RepID=F7NF04_9FIRM|nr:DNA starvation/stationary phase protection protein [Acetonema longum]EGO65565.1 DNA protection during starvation protein [Acetonema longum DSM 6540]